MSNPYFYVTTCSDERLTKFIDMVLEDVTELYVPCLVQSAKVILGLATTPDLHSVPSRLTSFSDYTGAQIKLPKLLLNGNNVCMV